MRKILASTILAASLASLAASAEPLKTVDSLDLERYKGRWYEIARFQQRFERDLVGVTAEYSLRPDGRVDVLNSGFKYTLDGKPKAAKGVARRPDPSKPGRLEVSFFGPFYGDYLVFGLDEANYSWALVGDDSRKYLWFLARSPQIEPELLERMRELAVYQGYDLTDLYMVPQKTR